MQVMIKLWHAMISMSVKEPCMSASQYKTFPLPLIVVNKYLMQTAVHQMKTLGPRLKANGCSENSSAWLSRKIF
jgi:hypothetical protein